MFRAKSRSAKNTFRRGFVNVGRSSADAQRGRGKKKELLPSISIIQVYPRRRHIFTSAPGIKFHPRGALFALRNKGRKRDGLSHDGTLENEGVAPEAKVTRTLSSFSWRCEQYQTRKERGGASNGEGWRINWTMREGERNAMI